MKRRLIYSAIIAALLPVLMPAALAANQDQLQTPDKYQTHDEDRPQTRDQAQSRQIYGAQLNDPAGAQRVSHPDAGSQNRAGARADP
jgi:hypothetical protein